MPLFAGQVRCLDKGAWNHIAGVMLIANIILLLLGYLDNTFILIGSFYRLLINTLIQVNESDYIFAKLLNEYGSHTFFIFQ